MNGEILNLPPLERVKELIEYDPHTGVLSRIKNQGRIRAGTVAGTISGGYISIGIDMGIYRGHRLAWLLMTGNDPGPYEIDHINGNTLDNRWENLRLTDRIGNGTNTRRSSRNTSGHKGVSYDKSRNKWSAEIICRGIKYRLGRFTSLEEAAKAYDTAAENLHQEFMRRI